ncbi:CoA transferase [Sphingomonas antarctica]|uniref:CaiB/BaiF CoA transferase family protein n=1 Tax=Sphingomonas antarctica TaxID=2040274 RepID=UPI0039ED7BE5
MTDASMTRPPPLTGRRVLDLSRVLAGPWCGQILADLGAEVIKVENPKGGDDTRAWGPPFAGGESAYYLSANRGKRSIAVDLASAEGQAIVLELAARADILIENYKLGGLDRFGLDYASVAKVNPRLIYCSISGYGRTGPAAARLGYDYVIQAEGGLMAITGETDGPPVRAGVAVADLFTGMAAAQACLAALIAADRDGLGQHIDMALYDCQLAMLGNVASDYLISGNEAKRHGNGHPTVVPYENLPTADGRVVIAVGNDRQFAALATLLGRADLAADDRFTKNAGRIVNREALLVELKPLVAEHTTGWWLENLPKTGIPGGEVTPVSRAVDSEVSHARGMVVEVPHPTAETIRLMASPLKLSGTPVRAPQTPPLLGQDSDAVLAELGYDEARIERLRASGAIA